MPQKVFRKMLDRRGARGTVVGTHTMQSATIAYIGELHKFVSEAAGDELRDKLAPVLDEYRNFEECAVNYLKGGR